MKNDKADMLHSVWDKAASIITGKEISLDRRRYDELMATIFCPGPYYFYIVDFFDRQIEYAHPSIRDVLGRDPETVTFDDILSHLHPDDMPFIAKAEEKAIDLIYNKIGRERAKEYKVSYCFRLRVPDGSYQLFQHQALILATDEDGRFAQSLNIHTNISHISQANTRKVSLICITGGPSYLNMEIEAAAAPEASLPFTRREVEIMRMLSEGLRTREIAARLKISDETVKTHRRNILNKTGCPNTTALIRRCIEEGLI